MRKLTTDQRRDVRAVLPYLREGSVLAFDQLGHARWPGETAALRDVLGSDRARINILPGRATLARDRQDWREVTVSPQPTCEILVITHGIGKVG